MKLNKKFKRYVLATLLLLVVCVAVIEVPKLVVLRDVVVASSLDNITIAVHTGGGRVLHKYELGNDWWKEKDSSIEEVYFPMLSSDRTQILYVHIYGKREGSGYSRNVFRHELCRIDVANGKREVLITTDGNTPILSPIWYKDDQKILVLLGNKIHALDLDGGVRWKSDIPNARMSRTCSPLNGYIRLNRDQSKLFIHANQMQQIEMRNSSMATLDLESQEVEWLSLPRPSFLWGKASPEGFIDISGEDALVIESLYGSTKNPVLCPTILQDGKYYFYATYREGLFASYWIEGYNRESGKEFHVLTYKRVLYTE